MEKQMNRLKERLALKSQNSQPGWEIIRIYKKVSFQLPVIQATMEVPSMKRSLTEWERIFAKHIHLARGL